MSDTNPDQIADSFDFGFSAVTLDELEVIQETNSKLEESDAESTELRRRLDAVYAAVQPLLNNLKNDPSKDYIYWPQRMEKIEAFSDHLDALFSGNK
jgi:hypothetical protein